MEDANNGSDSSKQDGRTAEIDKHENHHKQPTRIRLKSGDLEVKASSPDEDANHLARICSEELERMERQRLVGEYQVIEEENMFDVILGGD